MRTPPTGATRLSDMLEGAHVDEYWGNPWFIPRNPRRSPSTHHFNPLQSGVFGRSPGSQPWVLRRPMRLLASPTNRPHPFPAVTGEGRPCAYDRTDCSAIQAASCARERKPSLVRLWPICISTVFSAMKRAPAISRLVSPNAIWMAISCSRLVRAPRDRGAFVVSFARALTKRRPSETASSNVSGTPCSQAAANVVASSMR